MPQSKTGLTLVEILIACAVIAALILLGLSIWNRQERARLQALANEDPGHVFELSITPAVLEVVAGGEFNVMATIHNPTRHELEFTPTAQNRFLFVASQNTITLLKEQFVLTGSQRPRSFSEASSMAVYGMTIATKIPPGESVDIPLAGTIAESGIREGIVHLTGENATFLASGLIDSGLLEFKVNPSLRSNEVTIDVTEPHSLETTGTTP